MEFKSMFEEYIWYCNKRAQEVYFTPRGNIDKHFAEVIRPLDDKLDKLQKRLIEKTRY